LSVAPQNRRREDGMGHTSRSHGLLRQEASHARLSQSSLKTGGDTTTGGARGIIVEVPSCHIPKFPFQNVNHFSHKKLKIYKRIHLF
jgi:hypothetical protein